MKVLGILGSFKRDGITGQMLDQVLANVDPKIAQETIFLNDYTIMPKSADLDVLVSKLKEADVWILAAPTYWGGISGIMKNFLDCLRQLTLRFDKYGDPHALGTFANKHYILLTNCYTKTLENVLTGATDATFQTFDKVMTAMGVIKVGEAVQTNTFGLKELAPKKKAELKSLGQKVAQIKRKDDLTVKRYIELFFIVAVMTFITMFLQTGILKLLGLSLGFWSNYISFVLIFFILLATALRILTLAKHKRK